MLPPDGEGGLVVGAGPVDLAVPVDDPAQHLVRPGAQRAPGSSEPRPADQRRDQRARLAQVAALLPEPPDGRRDPERELGVAARVGPVDGRAEVRVLALELVEGDALPLARELRRQLLRPARGTPARGVPSRPRRRPPPPAAPARTRGSAPASRTAARRRTSPLRTRLWSTSDAEAVETSWPGSRAPPTASARSRSKPPTNTARRSNSRRARLLEQLVAPHDRAAQRPLALAGRRPRRRRGGRAGPRAARGSPPG